MTLLNLPLPLLLFTTLLPVLPATTALTTYQPPLIIWHGLGDNYKNPSLTTLINQTNTIHPNTSVHLIHLGETPAADTQATFFGNLTDQLTHVCNTLSTHPVLSSAPEVNALGFSQGGQFLRAYIERCNSPPVRNLVTFGSQHNGITEFQECGSWDFLCRSGEAILESGKWSPLVQGGFVPAQYFRDPAALDGLGEYLRNSNFLADVNNERELKNSTYMKNLARVRKFVMYMFEEDQLVHPKESAWFAEVNATTGEVTPLEERRLYTEDWIGLKGVAERGGLVFRTAPGGHMQIGEGLMRETIREFFGPVQRDEEDGEGEERVLIKQG